MTDDWMPTDEEVDAWLDEWKEVDREAADYLAERLPEVLEPLTEDEAQWIDALAETFSPTDEPVFEGEEFASVMALQHVDWLGLALGVARRGAGEELDAAQVLADVEALDDVEGEIEDPEGTRRVIRSAILVLTRPWQELGVLDADGRLTDRGVWGIPRAIHRSWTR